MEKIWQNLAPGDRFQGFEVRPIHQWASPEVGFEKPMHLVFHTLNLR